MNVEKALFSVLRQEVGGEPCDCLDPRLLPELLALAKKHDLAHILANACSNAGLLGEDETSEALRQSFMLTFYRSQQQEHVLNQACRSFEALSIPYIPLKGSVIRQYYPQGWMRAGSDIDILIHPADTDKAIDCLKGLGYRLEISPSGYDHSLYSPLGIHLELHHSLTQLPSMKKPNALLARSWEYTVAPREDSCQRALTNEMFMLYHIAHMAKHFILGGCGIRPFLDLWVLRDQMSADTQALEALLAEAGLLEFYHGVQAVVEVWFDNKPHTEATATIEEFILTGGVYGTQANAFAVRAAGGESRIKTFWRLMFMPRINLAYIYPKLERYPLLMPYYQVKRWFGLFSKTRRDRLKRLTDTRSAVTKAQANSTADLLAKLGLDQ